MTLVLIDVDGTLLSGPSSESRFMYYLVRNRILGLRQFWHFFWFAIRRAPEFRHHVWKKNKAYLSGLEVEYVRQYAVRFVQQHLIKQLRPGMKERIRQHQQNADLLALVTGTPDFIAEPLARVLGIEHCVATRCAQYKGRYTSAPPLEHPFAETKILLAERLCESMRVELSKCTAYADSFHDRLLLDRVAKAVAVEPDKKLERIAQRDGWEILKIMPQIVIH